MAFAKYSPFWSKFDWSRVQCRVCFMVSPFRIGLAAAVMLTLASGMAQAADDAVTVRINMARVLRIEAPAATVIIGNPGVADVTIQDPQTLILTGKSYGQTNLIILDVNGEPIADTILDVVETQADTMTVYRGAMRNTLVCSPTCQSVIMVGDDPGFTGNVIGSSNMVQGAAAQ